MTARPARLVLASGNPGKVRELARLLSPLGIEITPQSALGVADVAETGLSFIENALIKARHAAQATGQEAVADDSGLIVDALDGAPGLYSARYAGPGAGDRANIDKLLAALEGVPEARRTARFFCCIALLRSAHDPVPLVFQATWEGRILETPRGEGGFGYDPVFLVPTHGCSAAELPPGEKDRLSHRGQALRMLARALEAQGGRLSEKF